MKILPIALLISATATAAALAQDGQAPFMVAEQSRSYDRLDDAVRAIGSGTGTILIAPGGYRECAVQSDGSITFRAREPGTVIFDGVSCEGKAALVLRGRSATVDGVIFQNMRVPDANGAGIRLEQGDLHVVNSLFRNSEQGILTAADPAGEIRIDRSSFQHLGRCDRGLSCAHSIYVGGYGKLSITRSRFELGNGGHYVKSRAAIADIVGNSFDDTGGRETNYMIDLPAGATGLISGNLMVQGRSKENYSAFIAVAAEGKENSSNGLSIKDNRASFAPGVDRASSFVADWSGDRIALGTNQLGRGIKPLDRR
ncbi:right-handed parallel beta-helix repeat-containing protein [Rhizorhapis sp.]|uniref:right-handed parallel beta-helix repeat-containing protein n=1 Tax=Rhizorhapis sp. TaxID=1968842 RepID=UPI002B49772D|nr:right-handed parallel beta-helix repeat-containing protein [Rhizorhapis sp.]HKR15986.1 right-handed parallel beta-helix repeat-containing protein [Rhizorhapis sp.]